MARNKYLSTRWTCSLETHFTITVFTTDSTNRRHTWNKRDSLCPRVSQVISVCEWRNKRHQRKGRGSGRPSQKACFTFCKQETDWNARVHSIPSLLARWDLCRSFWDSPASNYLFTFITEEPLIFICLSRFSSGFKWANSSDLFMPSFRGVSWLDNWGNRWEMMSVTQRFFSPEIKTSTANKTSCRNIFCIELNVS